jgi:hypothetical protein
MTSEIPVPYSLIKPLHFVARCELPARWHHVTLPMFIGFMTGEHQKYVSAHSSDF